MTTGIYKIESVIKPNRIYIGSAINIQNRWRSHLFHLRKDKHPNIKLQRHFNKHGEEDLTFSILLECNKDELIKYEQQFIDSYNPWFNVCRKAGSNLGIKWSLEARERYKEVCKKRHPISEETRRRMSDSLKGENHPLYGKHHSEEAREKMRKPRSEEARKNMRKPHKVLTSWNKGLKMPDEYKQKLKGRIPWNKGVHTGVTSSSMFQKGRIPWNKGLKLKKAA